MFRLLSLDFSLFAFLPTVIICCYFSARLSYPPLSREHFLSPFPFFSFTRQIRFLLSVFSVELKHDLVT